MESMKPLLLLVFYFMDKIKRFRLTREAKVKADKNRSKVKEAFWKSMHAAKAEKAQVNDFTSPWLRFTKIGYHSSLLAEFSI
jgi:hypothetical protein